MTGLLDEAPALTDPSRDPSAPSSLRAPTAVTVVSDSAVVRLGVQAMLDPWWDLVVTARSWDCTDPVPAGCVVLADPGPRLSRAVALAAATPRPVLLYGRDLSAEQVRGALAAGCAGHVDLSTGAPGLRAAIEDVRRGRHRRDPPDQWPGRCHGLSRREAETLVLVCQGLTNHDIAARLELTLNTVKSYLRTAYRKIGAGRRPEAVRWGVENGLLAAAHPSVPAGRTAAAGG